jgi:primosomal protein N' (replication factor Y)
VNTSLHRTTILRVALDVPSAISARGEVTSPNDTLFDYTWHGAAQVGQRIIVPWGRQTVMGLIVEHSDHSALEPARLREALAVLNDVEPLPSRWFDLIGFAARYYQRSFGEVALPALPALLRKAGAYQLSGPVPNSRGMVAIEKKLARWLSSAPEPPPSSPTTVSMPIEGRELSEEQTNAVAAICASLVPTIGACAIAPRQTPKPWLLFGITGSGKTEVYLHAIRVALNQGQQVLVLVPEINLTPQLERLFRARFPHARLATLHSGMADGERAMHWLAAHRGQADLLLGTRMAVLTPLPRIGLIIVDEEHDPSFKQQEGLRYSARDLAVMRSQQEGVPVVLGSATPSCESWSQVQRGRYTKLTLTSRAVQQASLPEIRLIDVRRKPMLHGFTEDLRVALDQRLQREEQSLVFLNRRGYAPVLCCSACGWISDCRRCSAHMVYHKSDRQLHCHHCGLQAPINRACPDCGNTDLAPLGRGTQRVEEALLEWFPQARIARIDRDSTRRKGTAEGMFAAVHGGAVDILVGTQMVAKGHDFQNLTLVCIVDADGALFSQDFRAPERLFANLMQVAGRAGRADKPGEVLIQTRFTTHPLFAALTDHDYVRFADAQLAERHEAGLPPYSFQAMLRAEARTLDAALKFLATAREQAGPLIDEGGITLYDPVPMPLMRLANLERAQLLIEAAARPLLQSFLPAWIGALQALRTGVRWHIEVDPVEI